VARFVVDCETPHRIAAGEIEVAAEHKLVAPTLVCSQALAALYEAARRGEISAAEGMERVTRINSLKVRFLGDKVLQRQAWKVAGEQGWETTHDAEYVALTRLQADMFFTSAGDLAREVSGSSRRRRSTRSAQPEPECVVSREPVPRRLACPTVRALERLAGSHSRVGRRRKRRRHGHSSSSAPDGTCVQRSLPASASRAPRDPPRARGEPRRAGCWDGIPGPTRNGNRAFSRDADSDLFEISEYRR
jgi:predicted nucleic acid-binding protein